MNASEPTIAERLGLAARDLQHQRTGHMPDSVSVMLDESTLVITLYGALSAAETAISQNSAGAARVQEYHRQLFYSSSDLLRLEIERITGAKVLDASAEIEPNTGAVVHTFKTGTMVQVFQLAVPTSGAGRSETGKWRSSD